MRKLLILLISFLFASTAFAQESVWFDGNYEDAKIAADKTGKMILIDFYQDG